MNITKTKDSHVILFIFLAAFLIRILYIFQVLHFPLTEYLVRSATFDQYGFDRKALFIAQGNWIGGSEVFGKEPLYYYFLAIIYKLFGLNHFAVYFMQALLTSLGVVLIYKATENIFNRTTACITSLILAFYSISIFYDAVLLRASLITFLNILLFYLLAKTHKEKRGFFYWLLLGVVLGLSMLARHNMLLPFAFIYIFSVTNPLGTAFKKVLIFIAGACIVLLPVIARNYIVSDYKMPVISADINAFWVGNVHDASGADFDQSPAYQDMAQQTRGNIKNLARLFFKEVKNRPREYLKLYTRKIWMFFNSYEFPSNTNYYLYREESRTLLKWPLFNFRFICAAGIAGLFLSFFKKRRPWLAYIFLAVLSLQVILFHIQARYRLPVVPFFIIFCSYGIYCIFEEIKKRRFVRTAVIVGMAIFFYVILKPDLTFGGFTEKGQQIRAIDRTNLALACLDEYRTNKSAELLNAALKQCNLIIKTDRDYYTAYRIKGYIYLEKKYYNAAVKEYKSAITHKNRNPFLYNELAGVYFEKGDYKKAFIFTKRALYLFPGNKLFEKNLNMIPELP